MESTYATTATFSDFVFNNVPSNLTTQISLLKIVVEKRL